MLEEGEIVVCTVEKIERTNVFVKILYKGKELGGNIVLSEIAPGRIRNLRDYVVPNKKIVCKVLRITPSGNIELSLRRVTQKEKKEALERERQERGYINIFKSILKDKAEKVIGEITKEKSLYDFIQEVKENPEKLEKLIGKKDAKRILDTLKSQKQKEIKLKKEISLTTTKQNGLNLIKEVLQKDNCEIKYLGGGRYSIKTKAKNIKRADNKLKEILQQIEKESKEKGLEFQYKR